MPEGGAVPPRPTLEPDDLVTPAQAAGLLGVPSGTVRQWILRNEIAAVDARLRRKREAREAA